MNNLERDILHYGEFIADDDYCVGIGENGWCIRIRLIKYEGYIYYHKMIESKVVECKKVGKAL